MVEFKCVYCSYKSKWDFAAEHHRKIHDRLIMKQLYTCGENLRRIHCNYCPYASYTIFSMYKHRTTGSCRYLNVNVKDIDKEKQWYHCSVCEYKSKAYPALKRHLVTHLRENKQYHCEKCSFRSNFKADFQKHVTRFHSDKALKIRWFFCEECDFRCSIKASMRLHVIRRHSPASKIKWFQCEKCPKRFKMNRDLKIHISHVHIEDENIKWSYCKHCPYKTAKKYYLKLHQIRHTPNEKIKWYHCGKCLYKAKLKQTLNCHYLRHHAKVHHSNVVTVQWWTCLDCTTKYFNCTGCSSQDQHVYFEQHIVDRHLIALDSQKLNGSALRCTACLHTDTRRDRLINHFSREHITEEVVKGSKCQECNLKQSVKVYTKRKQDTKPPINSIKLEFPKININRWTCIDCLEKYYFCIECSHEDNSENFDNHLMTRHIKISDSDRPQPRFSCIVCEYSERKIQILCHFNREHIVEQVLEGTKCYKCNVKTIKSEQSEENLTNLQINWWTCNDCLNLYFNCTQCNEQDSTDFFTNHIMDNHLKQSETQKRLKIFSCTRCHRSDKWTHIFNHFSRCHIISNSENNMKCYDCNRKSNTKVYPNMKKVVTDIDKIKKEYHTI